MKKIIMFLLNIALVTMLVGCGNTDPVLKAIIKSEKSEKAEYQYITVYNNGKSVKTNAFDSDEVTIYTAKYGDFSSIIEGNKVRNMLKCSILIDDKGKEIAADETMKSIMQTAADEIQHDILQFTIVVDGDRYFAFVKLNVNWSDPCILYEYNVNSNSLIKICKWDGVDLVGLSI